MSNKSMGELEKDFEYCINKIKTLNKIPTDDEKLELYGYYKQVKFGDINTNKPSIFDIKQNAKWKSWNNCKGLSKRKAIEKYIITSYNLIIKYDTIN